MHKGKEQTLDVQSRWWSFRRQRLGKAALSLEEALYDVFGVYSAHPSAPLSLWARSATFSADAFHKLEEKHRAFRIPAMRGSIFLLLHDDAIQAFSGLTTETMPPLRWLRYTNTYAKTAYASITIEEYQRLKAIILEAANEPLSTKQIQELLGKEKGALSIAKAIAKEGELIRVGTPVLRSNNLRYMRASARGINLRSQPDQQEALRNLAQRYLSAFGPARIQDFQWWAGITNTQATTALAALNTVTLANGSLLLAEDFENFNNVLPLPADSIAILPMWDSYTMGYAPDGRQRFVDPAHQGRIYNGGNGGDGLGTVLVAGKAVAAWHITFSGNNHKISFDLFDEEAEPLLPAIYEHFEEITTVLNGNTCQIERLNADAPPLASSVRAGLFKKKSIA